jgi:hypothetical protein
MARVLVTGMSGTGKTTVLAELRRRGRLTVDTDDDGWVLPDGRDRSRMDRLLARTDNPYGRTAEQRAEIADYVRSVEPLLRAGATLELDARSSVHELGVTQRAPAGPRGSRRGRRTRATWTPR